MYDLNQIHLYLQPALLTFRSLCFQQAKSEMICSLSLQSEDTKVIKVVNEPNIRFEFWERMDGL